MEVNKPLHNLVIIDIFGIPSGFLVLPHYSTGNTDIIHGVVLTFGFSGFGEFTKAYPGGVSGYSDMNKVMLETKFRYDDPDDFYRRVISSDIVHGGDELAVAYPAINNSIEYDGGQIFMMMPTVKTFSKVNYHKEKPIPYEDMWFCRDWHDKRSVI